MRIAADMKRFLQVDGAGRMLFTLFCYGIGMGILAPMNAIYLSESIGLSKNEVVSIFVVSLLLNMGTTITVGLLSDKLRSRKRLVIVAALLCLVGLFIYMNAEGYVQALIGMCVVSAPSGLIMGQLFAISRNHFARLAGDIVEMAQIWLRAGYSVGFFCGLLAGANLYLIATFQGVLWGNFAGYAMLVILLLFYREHSEEKKQANMGASEPFSLIMLIALLLLACADAIRGLYLPLVVKTLFGKPEYMSYIWSSQAVFELLFMTIAGYWAAKYGSKIIILIGGFGALITYTIYALHSPLIVFFLIQPIYSFFVSILYGVAMGYVQRMFAGRTGFGASLYVFISLTASLIGYLLPLFIEGYDPSIFVIPIALVSISITIMSIVLIRERRLSQLPQ
ncbi:MFS transporter [Paenibacillus sp. FSL A5-0031]|uniref:MFS transporter n=1 Tax=Paenibacillus sp. FSL A5-0031 TaxID=1920420 RepID=UPI00096DF2B7|nr:MFS transporter [Paenibacillus sp. FSL A5-0031]OME77491.1 MFS transporter [Paenibacillus sp. FSL A5-0031]